MQQFSLVYNSLFVFLEHVDEPRPIYDCGQLMQCSSTIVVNACNAQLPKFITYLKNCLSTCSIDTEMNEMDTINDRQLHRELKAIVKSFLFCKKKKKKIGWH